MPAPRVLGLCQTVDAMNRVARAGADGLHVDRDKINFEQYAARWLDVRAGELRPSTIRSYRSLLERYVIPTLGTVPLQSIEPEHLDRLYAALLTGGRTRGPGLRGPGLSPRTVALIHVIIHRALGDAVRKRTLHRNPADLADPPRGEQTRAPETTPWTLDQTKEFLDQPAVREHELFACWWLAALTGARRGELLALAWSDVDFERGIITIRSTVTQADDGPALGPPKTRRGRRQITGLGGETIAVLTEHRTRQRSQHVALGVRDELDLVFPNLDGTIRDPNLVTRMFTRLAAATTGLPVVRLHDLRHGHLTHLVEMGVHPAVIAERAGHSSVAFTLDRYVHSYKGAQDQGAQAVEARVTGARNTLALVKDEEPREPEPTSCDHFVTNGGEEAR
jgi:integrase